MSGDSLGDRMKIYENAYRVNLPIRMPVIIRVDGKAFHTYTAKCKRPVDQGLVECMNDTAIAVCEEVQGAKLAYIQSDEISILVTNYDTLDTQSWFDNNLQKMVSVSAAVASVTFTENSPKIWGYHVYAEGQENETSVPIVEPAFFDSRAFVLPKEEVCNYFLWRQQDATRNSVQMLARTLYSHKQLEGKCNSDLQELIWQKGINWNDCPTTQKRGRCIVKKTVEKFAQNPLNLQWEKAQRSAWEVDNEIPVFSQDRSYIEKYI